MPRSLLLAAVGLMFLSDRAGADGLIYRLPPDGSWAIYRSEQHAEHQLTVPPGVELAERARATLPKTAVVTGFLVLRSVGVEQVDGRPCRWIEIEHAVQMAGQTASGAEAERGERQILLKLLVPEGRLAPGQDPFKHVLRMRFKDGRREAETIEDPRRRQYELDRFRPLFPEPAADGRRHAALDVAPSPTLPSMKCEPLTFRSKYTGPLAAGRGRWSYEGEHRLLLCDAVPFGVAALEFTSTSTETAGENEIASTTSGARKLILAAHGSGAIGRMPEN